MIITPLINKHQVIRVNSKTNRITQFPPAITTPPEHLQKLSLCREDLNTMVIIVSHIHLSSTVAGNANVDSQTVPCHCQASQNY